MEAVCVKSEPEWEGDACGVSEATSCLEGGWLVHHEVKVEHDWENVSRACGESETAAKVDLYEDHQVKEEVVLDPELLQPPDVVFALQASLNQVKKETCAQEALLGRTCSVSLERMIVDANHLICRVGLQTYKLRLCPQSPLPLVQNENESNAMKNTSRMQTRYQGQRIRQKPNKSKWCVKASLKKGKTNTEEQKASVSSRNNSKTDAASDKPYKCIHCSYVSAHRYSLLIHGRIHTGEKPYKCGHCNFSSAHRKSLHRHEMMHTGEKLYKCAYCSFASARKAAVLFHERNHIDDKPYQCDNCDFSCAHKKNLRRHERLHAAEPGLMEHDHALALLRPHSTDTSGVARYADHTYARRGPAPAPCGDASEEEIDVVSLTPHLPRASSPRVRTASPSAEQPRIPRTMTLRPAARKHPVTTDSNFDAETADTKRIHNDKERIRRFDLKTLFDKLKKQIPAVKDIEHAPKIVIIREADVLCRRLREKEFERDRLRERHRELVAKWKTLHTLRLPPH